MNLKKNIQLISYINTGLVLGLLAGAFAVFFKAPDRNIFALELLICIPGLLSFFFRKAIVAFSLKRSRYPGVFYAVLDKLNLTRNLDIHLTDELLNDMYKPGYSTSQFIEDNNLKTEIGPRQPKLPYQIISTGIAAFILFYSGQKFHIRQKPALFIAPLIFIGFNVFLWTREKKQPNDQDPEIIFSETALTIYRQPFYWTSIYDWRFSPGGKNQSPGIVINYYDTAKNIREASIPLSAINTDRIDFLLLMTHFKGKYGQS